MSLLTLPRLTPVAARGLAAAAANGCGQPTPAQRGRLARRVADAVRRGSLRPREAIRALQGGDAGMAALLHRAVRLPQRPFLPAAALPLQAFDHAPGEHVRAPLADLMRVLASDGDLTPQDCRAIAAASGTFGNLVRRVNNAWNRRCARLTAPIKALLPEGTPLHSSYLVMPGALLAVLQPGVYTHLPYETCREADQPPDAHVVATGVLIVQSPVSYADPEGRAALHAAWDAVCSAVRSPFMESAENGLGMLVGYAEELLRDAALGCDWNGDEPVLTEELLVELGHEIGIDGEDPDMRDGLRSFLCYTRATAKAPRWKMQSPALLAWLESNTNTPLGQSVRTLLSLAKYAKRGPRIDRQSVAYEYSDEGLLPVCLLPTDTGLDGYFQYVIDQNFQNCAEAEVSVIRDPSTQASLGDVLDRLVIDAALVAAAASVLAPPPSEGDDATDMQVASDFGDDDEL